MYWRLIQDGYHDAYTNMAIDEALLQSEVPVLRFYRWRPPAISIGYFQKLEEEINLEECKRWGIDYVRRITGGKAVLHDRELTYSFVISTELMPKSVIESYKVISRAILIALEGLGLKPAMNPAPLSKDRMNPAPFCYKKVLQNQRCWVNTKRCGVKEGIKRTQKSPLCFSDPSYYEIVVNGRKIVGSAQVRKNGKLLQHGSILIDLDIEKMCSLFKAVGKASQVQERVTSLNDEPRTFKQERKIDAKKVRDKLGKRIEFEDVAFALRKGFEENFNIKLIPDELTRKERILVQEIAVTKFDTKEWNHLR